MLSQEDIKKYYVNTSNRKTSITDYNVYSYWNDIKQITPSTVILENTNPSEDILGYLSFGRIIHSIIRSENPEKYDELTFENNNYQGIIFDYVCEFEVNDDKIYALIKKDNKEYSTKIYTIMVCSKLEEKIYTKNVNGNIIETKAGFNDYGDTRVWGFYTDKDAAIEALHFNSTDMNETCYEYACLEAYDEGISNCRPHETQWFKFDHNINGYFEIETPILEKRICSRAMG